MLLTPPHTFLIKLTGAKLLKYQENSPWLIISIDIDKEKFDADHCQCLRLFLEL